MKENDKEKLKYGLFLIPLGLIVFFVLIIPIISVITGSLKEDGSNVYTLDHYPDENVFLSGEYIRRKWDPDFLMIHPMNIDDEGHKFGVDSSEYRNLLEM